MKADTLKKSILQWAIEGKLVPQLESEPAVEQIGETPEDVSFAIPEKWKWVQLNNVTTQITDGTHHSPVSFSKEDPRGKFLYITAKNIKFTGVDCSTATYVTEDTHKEIASRCLPEYRDVLYIKDGATTGVVTVNNIEEPFSLLSSVALIKPIKLMLDPDFLSFTLRSKSMTDLVRGKMKGTGIPRVTLKILKKFSIPLPPLEEQRRIVAKLNELLPLVEIYGKEQEALEKMEKEFPDKLRASLLQEAIQGKLVPQLESEPEVTQIGEAPEDVPFAIPEKWRWVRVSDVAHTNPKVTAQTSSTEVSFIPMAALSAGYISQIALDAKRSWGTVKNGYTKFIEGDVLLAKITPCFQNRKSAIAKKLSNGIGCGSSEFHVLRVNENIVTQEYLLMFLKSQWFITYGVENFKGTAGQQRLGTSDLKKCLFPLPPMSEQHRIVAKLNELLDSVKHLEYNVSKT